MCSTESSVERSLHKDQLMHCKSSTVLSNGNAITIAIVAFVLTQI